MGRSSGYDNHIPLADVACVTAIDLAAANLVSGYVFSVYNCATRNECGGSFLHVNDVCILYVNFDHSGCVPATGVHHILVGSVKENRSLSESLLDFVLV